MEMTAFSFDRQPGKPLYERLYQQIKGRIVSGELACGEKLPSKLRLAAFLGVGKNTVETAYEQLMVEGYIESMPKRGYFVCFQDTLGYVGKAAPAPAPDAAPQEQDKPAFWADFHPGRVDPAYFPYAKWRKCVRDVLDASSAELLQIGDNQGDSRLRVQIAEYLRCARGVHCRPEQIVVGAGMEVLLTQLHMLLGRNACYGLEDPGYELPRRLFTRLTDRVLPVPIDDYGLRPEVLRKTSANTAYVTPSHQFPYGSVMPAGRRQELLAWAGECEGRYILEDDYDSEFRYAGRPVDALMAMDTGGRVVYFGTFSKAMIPSLRAGFMVLPAALLERYRQRMDFYHNTVSRIDQAALARFMEDGDFERHINRMRKVYRRKLERVRALLAPYGEQIRLRGDSAGFYVLLEVLTGISEKELCRRAEAEGLRVYCLSSFLPEGESRTPGILLGFAGLPEEKLEPAVVRLLRCWGLKAEASK